MSNYVCDRCHQKFTKKFSLHRHHQRKIRCKLGKHDPNFAVAVTDSQIDGFGNQSIPIIPKSDPIALNHPFEDSEQRNLSKITRPNTQKNIKNAKNNLTISDEPVSKKNKSYCVICKRSFSTNYNLLKHTRKFHQDSTDPVPNETVQN